MKKDSLALFFLSLSCLFIMSAFIAESTIDNRTLYVVENMPFDNVGELRNAIEKRDKKNESLGKALAFTHLFGWPTIFISLAIIISQHVTNKESNNDNRESD